MTGDRHGDFCSCVSGYRKPRIWSLCFTEPRPASLPFHPTVLNLEIKWGTALYCLNGLNFHILYLPRTELKSGSDFYIPWRDNAGSRCDDLPFRLFPQMGGWIRLRSTYGRPRLSDFCLCQSPRLLHRFHASQFPCNLLAKSSSSTFFSTLFPSSRQWSHRSVYSIMARIVIPSLTPHYINNSPWSVPVNLTFSRAEDFLLNFFSAVMYHLHTAILFTWTDYKTIFLPIVSTLVRAFSLVPPRDPLLYRRPLPVQRHLYNHSPAYSNAGYGSGFIYFYAMYPTKRAVLKKTKSTVPGALSQQDE